MTDSPATLLRLLEEQLLQPETRCNPHALALLFADEFREFGSSGRTFTKAEIIAELATESDRRITLTDFRCELLTSVLALVTYRSLRTAASEPTFEALRSSLWVLRDDRWQILFHQGTKILV